MEDVTIQFWHTRHAHLNLIWLSGRSHVAELLFEFVWQCILGSIVIDQNLSMVKRVVDKPLQSGLWSMAFQIMFALPGMGRGARGVDERAEMYQCVLILNAIKLIKVL